MAHDRIYVALCEALARPGCVLCRLGREHVQRYLDGFMYEDVTDVDLRAKMRAAQGFCREHVAQAILVRDSLGLAIIYQDILASVNKQMRAGATERLPSPGLLRRRAAGGGEGLARRISPERSCPACAVRDEIVSASIRTLLNSLSDPELAPLYQSCDGLCLPHLRQAFAACTDPAAMDMLAARQTQVIDGLVAELAEYIRKHDYRFAREPMENERDSWQRAIAMVAGVVAEPPP